MARHAQPVELAALKGAPHAHPERYRKEVPKSGFALGQAPEKFTDEQKAVWFELETYAIQGVLTGADRLVIEAAAILIAEFRSDYYKFPANKLGHLISCLARLGMTPADRQKLGTDKKPEGNSFDDF